MVKVVFTSDWHLGMRTEEIDRTKEIYSIVKNIIEHCKKLKSEGHDVRLVWGGDLFDTNVPSERHISVFIKLLGFVKKYDIETYVMAGNHEAVADPSRVTCLSFVREAKQGYPMVHLIDDIKTMKIADHDTGPLYFTFLPHVSNALIARKVNKKTLKKQITTKKYIDSKSKRILEKVGKGSQHYVFSHLNVMGAHGGSEENLLKKSEVYVPEIFTNPPMGYVKPTIVQGHIHSKQKVGNIDIIGSPIFCSFGEKDVDKCYAVYSVSGNIGEKDTVKYPVTSYRPFLQLEIDLMGQTIDFIEHPEVLSFLEKVESYCNDGLKPVIKFDVTIDAEHNSYDWSGIRKEIIDEFDCTVKNIIPRIIIKRAVRAKEQKLTLSPKDAVKVYIKRNLKKDKKKMNLIWKYSQKYLEV